MAKGSAYTAAAGFDYLDMEDEILQDARPGGGSRGGRRGGGRGGGSGLSRDVQISKALARLLRHQAEKSGIKLDEAGYAPLDKVLAYGPIKSLKVTLEDVQQVVANDEKSRWSLKPNPVTNPSLDTTSTSASDYIIRANQGHSIKLESSATLTPITLAKPDTIPERVLHGTYYAFWPLIVSSGGIKKMGRNHVHCSTGTPEEGVLSGMRKDAELVIEIDIKKSLEGGIVWWRSDNGVILSEGDENGLISLKYFREVKGRKQDVGVLWQDGQWVADLPEGIKITVPQGKGSRGGRGAGRGGSGRGGSSRSDAS
ncbi:RNA 2'-phosphotransferase, tpt1 / kptA family protein [Sarocladium implicatum]|nr:RNA 2'-phosphotransferase, tpt1 / kptA family protein [Sarocladium implicatum]